MKQKLINFKKRNWVPLLSAAIVLVFFLIVMIAGGVAPFGDYSFTFVDSMHQYLPFFSDYQGKLQNGGSMFYTYYTADVMEEGVGTMTYILTAFFAVFSIVNYWLSFHIFKGFELITNKWLNYDFYK